ncbi:TetR/AcrR family transcriptional regulator [Pedobacter sp. L105]|uniref:TetR/AcrR family transcriptional regulator n=1 Tax=Pedobacter sp. L105 TaxID=1641871 RepID=UPI00131AD8CB|nr:TetR/AcrR family transcriptional regulator [Pedobacter sp. L105]
MQSEKTSKQKLLKAVGTILKNEGFKFLKVTRIAQVACVDKKLVYHHFGTVENLIETFILSHDYWTNLVRKVHQAIDGETESFGLEDLLNFYLEKQYDMLSEDKIQHQIMLWGISEPNAIIQKIIAGREEVGESLFDLINQKCSNPLLNYRGLYAIIISGLCYLSLHSQVNNGTFCGIDLNEKEGKEMITSALKSFNAIIINQ